MNYLDYALSAEKIGLPKGEANENYRKTFEDATGIEIPITKNRKLSAYSQGKKFYFLRGMDMPARVNEGLIDFGVCGSDAVYEYPNRRNIISQEIGLTVCKFSILSIANIRSRIESLIGQRSGSNMMLLPTSRPIMLNMISAGRDLPFAAMDLVITGGVEAYPEITGVGAAADIVSSGKTALENGLVEVSILKDIRTTFVWKAKDESI